MCLRRPSLLMLRENNIFLAPGTHIPLRFAGWLFFLRRRSGVENGLAAGAASVPLLLACVLLPKGHGGRCQPLALPFLPVCCL